MSGTDHLLTVRCIRHGESASNAGLPTDDHMTIPLSDLGWRQAEEIAAGIVDPPDLIICSPMLRTQQTALPTQRKFPDVPVRVLDVGEFTCLSPVLCKGTTREERTVWRDEYWTAADPDLVHGDGAESFSTFWRRVWDAQDALERLSAEGFHNVLMFGHGQFLQALRWQILSPVGPSPDLIRQFHVLNDGNSVFNGRGFTAVFEDEWRIAVDNGSYLSITVKLFDEFGLSLKKAARLSGRCLPEFMGECGKRNVAIMRFTEEELEEDLRALREMK